MDDAAEELTGADTMAAGDCGSPTASVTVPSMRPFPPAAGMRSAAQDWLSKLARLHAVATTYRPPSANETSAQPRLDAWAVVSWPALFARSLTDVGPAGPMATSCPSRFTR